MDREGTPLILQSDGSVLLEVDHPLFEEARDFLARFAELESSPEHIHTYRITSLSLWNARAAGVTVEEVLAGLGRFSRFPVPENVAEEIQETMRRYGRLRLRPGGEDQIRLEADEPQLLVEVARLKGLEGVVQPLPQSTALSLPVEQRGHVKQLLLKAGYPVADLVGYREGTPLAVGLRPVSRSGRPLRLRPYQVRAVDAFLAGGGPEGGSGVVVLPCGAGKTMVGMAVMAAVRQSTLILCTGREAVQQWIDELLDKTTLREEEIGAYTGETKSVRPVTVATYSILTTSRQKTYPHFRLFHALDWGLIIYDEVHLLPAPIFRMTAELQARRRLGLTATLIREDGREGDVFSLIGPKRYDAPWKDLEAEGWIASASCVEIRVPLDDERKREAMFAEPQEAFRLAAENPLKLAVLADLIRRHLPTGDRILVMGRFLAQLEHCARHLQAPLVTGKTPRRERERLFRTFRDGDLRLLVVSNVANFSLDLPEASVAIELSGTYGSRQEEAQRLGRILRPKADGRVAYFYTIVSEESREETFARLRQRFLTEQGYRYRILRAGVDDFAVPDVAAKLPAGVAKVIDLAAYRRGAQSKP